jgi:hypothetical protein
MQIYDVVVHSRKSLMIRQKSSVISIKLLDMLPPGLNLQGYSTFMAKPAAERLPAQLKFSSILRCHGSRRCLEPCGLMGTQGKMYWCLKSSRAALHSQHFCRCVIRTLPSFKSKGVPCPTGASGSSSAQTVLPFNSTRKSKKTDPDLSQHFFDEYPLKSIVLGDHTET